MMTFLHEIIFILHSLPYFHSIITKLWFPDFIQKNIKATSDIKIHAKCSTWQCSNFEYILLFLFRIFKKDKHLSIIGSFYKEFCLVLWYILLRLKCHLSELHCNFGESLLKRKFLAKMLSKKTKFCWEELIASVNTTTATTISLCHHDFSVCLFCPLYSTYQYRSLKEYSECSYDGWHSSMASDCTDITSVRRSLAHEQNSSETDVCLWVVTDHDKRLSSTPLLFCQRP